MLFDLLNTPTTDQDLRAQGVDGHAAHRAKGQPIALYLLTSNLYMVQGFTDDPDKLLKSADSLQPGRSHVLTTEAEHQQDTGQIEYKAAELTANAPSSTTSQNNAIMSETTTSMQQQLRDLESFQICDRANFTLAAFRVAVACCFRLSGPQKSDLAVRRVSQSSSWPIQKWTRSPGEIRRTTGNSGRRRCAPGEVAHGGLSG